MSDSSTGDKTALSNALITESSIEVEPFALEVEFSFGLSISLFRISLDPKLV